MPAQKAKGNVSQTIRGSHQGHECRLRIFPEATAASHLDEEELADIIEHGLPNAWQCQMLIQGFDIINEELTGLTEFTE